ncbi:hypothetical protein VTP01DRAFT_9121 [Rhizomucor pusillus]|uniref:uncharacterized protein n=1 Tax=Rhizomucor pusillus TaxID=4840 RepID=UPI003743F4FB
MGSPQKQDPLACVVSVGCTTKSFVYPSLLGVRNEIEGEPCLKPTIPIPCCACVCSSSKTDTCFMGLSLPFCIYSLLVSFLSCLPACLPLH